MGFEVIHRELQHHLQLPQFKFAAANLRRVEGRLVVVAHQVVEIAGRARHGRRQQMLWQNHRRSQAAAIRRMIALANPVETVAGSHNPRIRRRPPQVLAEIFEYRGMFRWDRCEVIKGLVNPGDQAGGRHVVAKNSAIDHLGEERGLRNQFTHQVRNVLLTFGSERFLVARSTAESDDHDFSFLTRGHGMGQRTRSHESAAQSEARRGPQEFAPAAR